MYDYVIVGAGSAGAVLAARLSEDPDVRVLLVEAGPTDTADNIHIPAAFNLLYKSANDWDYTSAYEPGLNERRIYLPRGKTLGGSSSINAMIYIRGNRLDYDGWRDAGCTGWGYDDLLPYFIRAEGNERGAFNAYHGGDGPLHVSDTGYRHPISEAFIAAAEANGLKRSDDFNGAEQDGVGWYQFTIKGGRRWSTAQAYLHPNEGRPNLEVVTQAEVHRVVIENGRAAGVAGARFGDPFEYRAEREVIVCGGAYNSPKLLQLSGIGPAELLELLQIPVVVDNPLVGQNLVDHPTVGGLWYTDEPVTMLAENTPENVQLWMDTGTGPFSSNVASAGGFFRSGDDQPCPDLQFHFLPGLFVEEGLVAELEHGITLSVCLLNPASRGSVLLASADPTAKPTIRHNYFGEPEDMRRITAGMRKLLAVMDTEPVSRYANREHAFDTWGDRSDAGIQAHVRARTQTIYHPVGTCAMGNVVDNDLRVKGVEALRVVDASVMPTVPRGNTNAPVIAVAERAADLIRGAVAAPAREATATA